MYITFHLNYVVAVVVVITW